MVVLLRNIYTLNGNRMEQFTNCFDKPFVVAATTQSPLDFAGNNNRQGTDNVGSLFCILRREGDTKRGITGLIK